MKCSKKKTSFKYVGAPVLFNMATIFALQLNRTTLSSEYRVQIKSDNTFVSWLEIKFNKNII